MHFVGFNKDELEKNAEIFFFLKLYFLLIINSSNTVTTKNRLNLS